MPHPASGKVARTITVDTILITGFDVSTFPGKELIRIAYDSGYTDNNDKFVTVDSYNFIIDGKDYDRIMEMTPDTSSGLGAALEEILRAEVDVNITLPV